jgi:hypothetical protein
MWNKSIKLQESSKEAEDKDGFITSSEPEFLEGIPANFKDTTRSDQILANQSGYTADQNIEIVACNYGGQKYLYDEENGDTYEVKRTYQADKSMNIVLVCERRETGGAI